MNKKTSKLVNNLMNNWSERVRAPSVSFRHDGTTVIIDFLVRACVCAIGVFQTRWYHYNH